MAADKISQVRIGELVFRDEIYPRGGPDSATVARYAEIAQAAGDWPFPEILVDARTKDCVAGRQRVAAARRIFGEDGTIPAILRAFKDDRERMLAGMEENARHGLPFAAHDFAVCVVRSRVLGIDDAVVRRTLQLGEHRWEELVKNRLASLRGQSVALKRSLRHLGGQPLTEQQVVANERSSGMNPTFYVNQLLNLIENDALDRGNQTVRASLVRLQEAIANYLAAEVAA